MVLSGWIRQPRGLGRHHWVVAAVGAAGCSLYGHVPNQRMDVGGCCVVRSYRAVASLAINFGEYFYNNCSLFIALNFCCRIFSRTRGVTQNTYRS